MSRNDRYQAMTMTKAGRTSQASTHRRKLRNHKAKLAATTSRSHVMDRGARLLRVRMLVSLVVFLIVLGGLACQKKWSRWLPVPLTMEPQMTTSNDPGKYLLLHLCN
jgi:hypothetical protein